MFLFALMNLFGCQNKAAEALLTCQGGNMEACYGEGLGHASAAKPRYDEARLAWSKSCMNIHHAESCNALAQLVRDAKGGPRDLGRAAELFEIACKGEVKSACVDLGLLLMKDQDGLKAEPNRAVVLLSASCNQVEDASTPADGPHPLAAACDAVGHAYQDGVGVEPPKEDEERAAALYERACHAKYAPGCVSGGNLLAKERRDEDVARAADFYEQACKLDARQGCYELAQLHETKAWKAADDQKASLFFQKTCSIDATRGCFEAATLMENGRVKAREGEIEYLYNLACEHGNSTACTKRNITVKGDGEKGKAKGR